MELGKSMKAMVYHKYGSPDELKLEEVAKPTPKDDEVLVKVKASSINRADLYMLKGSPFVIRLENGFTPKKKILGADIAGQVEAVGKNVKEFKVGDEVFGDISANGWGGFAEYVSAKENALVAKPTNITFEEAAAVPMASVTAFQGLQDKGQIQSNQKVLIYGASGGVGTWAVQISKSFGTHVTAVCSTRNVEMIRSLGADEVIDYTKEDFAENGKRYDLILAANGDLPLAKYKSALTPNGIYVCTGGSLKQIFSSLIFGSKQVRGLSSKPNKKDLIFIQELLANGKIKSVIDKTFPLTELADAFRYFESGKVKGKIVISH
jgi:NADPH:quinone reductase-like Zn-dependent oxidoreductase